jgi:hypothetical protein
MARAGRGAGQLALPEPVANQRRYRRTRRLAAMVAPAAAHGGAVVADPKAFEIVEALVSLFMATDAPEGLTRSEIVAELQAAGFEEDDVDHRLDVLLELGAINRYLDKARHQRYTLDLATVAGALFFRKGLSRGGIEELLSLLRKTTADVTSDVVDRETVEQVLVSLRGLIGLWTAEVNRLVDTATSDELHVEREAHDDRSLTAEVNRLTELVAERFGGLGDQCVAVVRSAQDYVDAVGRLIDRVLVEAARRRDFSVLAPEDYLAAARAAPADRLATATTRMVWDATTVFVPGQAVAAAIREFAPAPSRRRRRPVEPPALDGADPLEELERRTEHRREQLERLAELLLQGASERDVTSVLRAEGWPAAAHTVARLSGLHQQPGSRYSVALGDGLIVDPLGPLTYASPLTLRADRTLVVTGEVEAVSDEVVS